MKKAAAKIVVFFLFSQVYLWGQISFSGLDISGDNNLLFRANFGGLQSQSVLFFSHIEDRTIRRLTVFPERMDLIDNGNILLVRNSAGASRIPVRGGLPQEGGVQQGFPSENIRGRIEEIAVSPNGRWILSIVRESPAYGTLILSEVLTGNTVTIATGVERPDKYFPASWSPDSRFFIYSRLGKLYYATVNMAAPIIDERFRYIGDGTINSVSWYRNGDFFYLRGTTVYRVRGNELFTRTLYSDFMEIGSITGHIPFEFDPYIDNYWMSPDGSSLLYSKGGRNVFYYPLETDDYHDTSPGLPYLILPISCTNIQVFWPASGAITIIASVRTETTTALAWRMTPDSSNRAFVPITPPLNSAVSLSPDSRLMVSWGERGIVLYDYANWRQLITISSRSSYSCLWSGNDEIITGDAGRIERIRIAAGGARILSRDLICLSGAGTFGFEELTRPGVARVLAQSNGTWYATDGQRPWAEIANPQLRASTQVSGQFRVYLETQSSGPYENLPMVRNTASVGTFSLISQPAGRPVSANSISGLREIGLCFDLYDDAEGLPEVLEALNRFGMKATFFLGGEFMRRYPSAVKEIAAAGHEAASMFFAPIDLSDSRYQIDNDFIARGLARTEDEYFNATGREMALLWHPPWYAGPTEAITAAARAGYVTVNRDIDPLDWISREDEKSFGIPQYSSADMIDSIINRITSLSRSGPIVPVRLGLLSGGRSDYLFRHINVLLDALAEEGYTVVPVSRLVR